MVMDKYEIDRILKLIKQIQNKESRKTAGKRFGADTNCLCKWFGVCECRRPGRCQHRRGSYCAGFKKYVIRYKKEHFLSARETAALFNIPSPTTVLAWEKRYDEGGIQALADKRRRKTGLSKDTQSMPAKPLKKMSQKELQAELRRLRAENASLKKGERLEEAKESINVKAEARIVCELALLFLFHFMENSASNPLPFTVTTRRHGIRTNTPEPKRR